MLVNQYLCHGLWLAESEAVSQSDAMMQILVNSLGPGKFWKSGSVVAKAPNNTNCSCWTEASHESEWVIQFNDAYLREQSTKRVCSKKHLQLDMDKVQPHICHLQ